MTSTYPPEKSPAALAALNGEANLDHHLTTDGDRPPPYDNTSPPPPGILLTSDEKAPGYVDIRSHSPTSPLTSPSTTSLTSLDEATRPQTSSSTKFFISQKGNTHKPWPFSNSSELVTPIYDATRTFPLFTSTRVKKCSGTCVFAPVYNADHQQPLDAKGKLEVHTTYWFGPGNDPEISFFAGTGVTGAGVENAPVGEDGRVTIPIRSKGKFTRSRWFEWNGDRYEWRYLGKGLSHAEGLVLQKVVQPADHPLTPPPETLDEKQLPSSPDQRRPMTPTSPRPGSRGCSSSQGCSSSSKGKGRWRKPEETYVTVAEFIRDPEENKRFVGFTPAGQGGWVTVYGKEDQSEATSKLSLPTWLVLTSCMVMLKRERDRRTMQIAMMIGGAAGGP